jgi:hypothetical protein
MPSETLLLCHAVTPRAVEIVQLLAVDGGGGLPDTRRDRVSQPTSPPASQMESRSGVLVEEKLMDETVLIRNMRTAAALSTPAAVCVNDPCPDVRPI